MTEMEAQFVPEDFGKTYELHVNVAGMSPGEHIHFGGYWRMITLQPGWAGGEFVNGETYALDADFVSRVEAAMKSPFSVIQVIPNCTLTAVEE